MTTKATHTRGPWNIHPNYTEEKVFEVNQEGGESWLACQTYVAQGVKIIAQVQMQTAKAGWPNVTNREEMMANAQLIASAPDLLAALEAVVASAYPTETEHPAMWQAWQSARAAISKAKGHQ